MIIVDESLVASEIADELRVEGFAPQIVGNKQEGLLFALSGDAAVLILDRLVRGEDSLDIVESMRERGVSTPVLMIAASGSANERIRGLRAGADDYLVKPFAIGELVARVDAIVRRLDGRRTTRLRVGRLEMDLIEQFVRLDGHRVELLPREFKILEYFMRHPGEVISREALLQHVWRYEPTRRTNTVDVHIGSLRRKLGDRIDSPILINVRRAGFLLRAS